MEIKPVKQTEKPKYPLKTELNEEELKMQIPKRWMQSSAAKIALGTLAIVSLTGCTIQGGLAEPTLTTEATASAIDAMPMGEVLAPTLNVAPLFIHGNGRGAFGCLMIAPPVFLSEYDALTAINEAAKEYGLNFSGSGTPEFSNVLQPITKMYPPSYQINGAEPTETADTNKMITLKVDFSDNEHGIAIEFISTNDVEAWNKSEQTISVGSYDTQDAAAQLSEALDDAVDQTGNYTVGILYDPCASVRPDESSDQKEWEEAEAKAQKMSEEQLKAQAKGFFEWLKAQGII